MIVNSMFWKANPREDVYFWFALLKGPFKRDHPFVVLRSFFARGKSYVLCMFFWLLDREKPSAKGRLLKVFESPGLLVFFIFCFGPWALFLKRKMAGLYYGPMELGIFGGEKASPRSFILEAKMGCSPGYGRGGMTHKHILVCLVYLELI